MGTTFYWVPILQRTILDLEYPWYINTVQNSKKTKINSITHIGAVKIFFMHNMHSSNIKRKDAKIVPMLHTLFQKQAICERKKNGKRFYLMSVDNIHMLLYRSFVESETIFYCSKTSGEKILRITIRIEFDFHLTPLVSFLTLV